MFIVADLVSLNRSNGTETSQIVCNKNITGYPYD